MSEFKNKSITSKGMELLSKALAGETLEFTKIQLGNGTCTEDVGLAESLVSPMQTLTITKISRKGGQVTLSTSLKVEDIISPFNWTEIGIYARVGNEEVLYMYGYTENSSYISKDSLNEKLINVTVLVSSVSEVTAAIDSSLVYLTAESLDEHNKDQEAHKDIRTLINELEIEVQNIDISGAITTHNADSNAHQDIRTLISGIDLTQVNNHVTAQHTTTKNLISAERATVVSAINSQTTTLKNSMTGDIGGKTIYVERINLNGIHQNVNVLKSYTNSKGGVVRILPTIINANYVTLTVDGTVIANNVGTSVLFGSGSAFIDVPFKTSFILYAGQKTADTVNTTSIAYAVSLVYYINP